MADKWPKIVARRSTRISPWMDVIEREVEFAPNTPIQSYHAVGQADYIGILAMTPQRLIPLVRQYRPAVESFTWELPAGLVDAGEHPAEGCKRELLEETGLSARAVHLLGTASPCTGRMSNRIHSFFVQTDAPDTRRAPEAGIELKFVSEEELAATIMRGEFISQLHLGAIALAVARGLMTLPRP
jgi:8-oxo-dGTP pyrophosphatase MutT (NUDIX family)